MPFEAVNTDPADKWFIFELLHGSSLASDLWHAVGRPGESVPEIGKVGVFEKYPGLKEAFDRAAEAIAEFYQVCGCHMPDDETPQSE